ncbi:PAS domain-containing protein [Microvirga roseola]|uniref:PAS domain-containing protein n=1 Tax=Microvirga roseola TaxID=2883126 RepID=UPI001E5F8B96|nr:PAS domain-containing protein [Microvirga roseola]
MAGFYFAATETAGRILNEEALREGQEAALRGTEARYRTLFEALGKGFCVVDMVFDEQNRPADYVFVEVNSAFEAQAGLCDAAGRSMCSLRPGCEAHGLETFGRVALAGDPVRFEHEAADTGRWYNVFAYRVGDPQQRRVALLFDDITERRRVEEAYRESEDRYRSLIAHSSEGTWLLELTPPVGISLPDDKQIELAYRNGRSEDLIGKTLDFPHAGRRSGGEGIFRRDHPFRLSPDRYGIGGAGHGREPQYFANSMIGVVENGFVKRIWGI